MIMTTVFLAGCSSKVEWNQKLTVTVEIDGQEYVGSSVSRMRYTSAGKVAFGSRGVSLREHIQGEAVVVDLGEHGHLFALWPYQKPGKYALTGRKNKKSGNDFKSNQRANFSRLRKISYSRRAKVLEPGSCPEDKGDYPMLVAFENLKFPSTIEAFNECGKNSTSSTFNTESFTKFYGQNASVKSIVFQITDEPITQGALSAVLTDDFFEKWHQRKKSLGGGSKCNLKAGNMYFCNLHKGKWMRKFPKRVK